MSEATKETNPENEQFNKEEDLATPADTSTNKKSKKVNKKLLFSALGFAAIILLVLILYPNPEELGSLLTDNNQTTTQQPAQTTPTLVPLKTQEQLAKQRKQKAQQTQQLKRQQVDFNKQYVELSQKIASLSNNEELLNQLKAITTQLTSQVQVINNGLNKVQKDLLAQSHKTQNNEQSIIQQISTLKQTLAELSDQSKQPSHHNPNYPAFNLVSVDLWNTVPQATIRHEGKFNIVKAGDSRLGWKVIDINFDAETIEVVNLSTNTKIKMVKVK